MKGEVNKYSSVGIKGSDPPPSRCIYGAQRQRLSRRWQSRDSAPQQLTSSSPSPPWSSSFSGKSRAAHLTPAGKSPSCQSSLRCLRRLRRRVRVQGACSHSFSGISSRSTPRSTLCTSRRRPRSHLHPQDRGEARQIRSQGQCWSPGNLCRLCHLPQHRSKVEWSAGDYGGRVHRRGIALILTPCRYISPSRNTVTLHFASKNHRMGEVLSHLEPATFQSLFIHSFPEVFGKLCALVLSYRLGRSTRRTEIFASLELTGMQCEFQIARTSEAFIRKSYK